LPALTRTDTAVIKGYLSDEKEPLEDREAPWLDIAESSGVKLPETTHFKPSGNRASAKLQLKPSNELVKEIPG
jgi:hypothetical protein